MKVTNIAWIPLSSRPAAFPAVHKFITKKMEMNQIVSYVVKHNTCMIVPFLCDGASQPYIHLFAHPPFVSATLLVGGGGGGSCA